MKRKTAFAVFLCISLISALILTSCNGEGGGKKADSIPTVQTAQSFEVDPSKIAGDTTEERMHSFVSLLNIKTTGFAKLFGHPEKVTGATPEESGTVYSYVLMVYGDEPSDKKTDEEYLNRMLAIGKQVVAYSAKFVADANEQSSIQLRVSYSNGNQEAYGVPADGVKMLRRSPSESWLQFVQSIPIIVVAYDEWQEAQQVITAFQIAVDEGYISEEEFNEVGDKLKKILKQQTRQSTGSNVP